MARANRRLAVCGIAYAAATLGARPAAGQVTGKVIGQVTQQPLGGAIVQLWDGPILVDSGTSEPDGSFHVAPSSSQKRTQPFTLTARRIGYRPASTAFDSAFIEMPILFLEPLVRRVSTARIEGVKTRWIDPCAGRPSERARALMLSAVRRYRSTTMELDHIVQFGKSRRMVDEPQRELISWVGLGPNYEYSTDHRDRRGRRARGEPSLPFPTPVPRRDVRGEIVGWMFPQFVGNDAAEFASKAFLDSARLVDRVSSNATVGFCIRGRTQSDVAGDIFFGADSSIAAIAWRFRVPDDRAARGGIALFASPPAGSEVDLLPGASIDWVQIPGTDRYEVTEYVFGQWLVAEHGSPSLSAYAAKIRPDTRRKP